MLTELEQTKRALAGKHRAIDDWLDARQALLVEYMRLAGLTPARTKQRSLPGHVELQGFCERLVDYVSAGHFEIYNHVVTAFEQASGDKLELAKRIYPTSGPAPSSRWSSTTSTAMPMRLSCCCWMRI